MPWLAMLSAADRAKYMLHQMPTIDSRIKPEEVPTWDGDRSTAIEYFNQILALEGVNAYVRMALARHLPRKLTGDVRRYYLSWSTELREYAEANCNNYRFAIRDYWLGEQWLREQRATLEKQYYCQKGHEDELPVSFILRRWELGQFLLHIADGRDFVAAILDRAPPRWRTILPIHSITSVQSLVREVQNFSFELIQAHKEDR